VDQQTLNHEKMSHADSYPLTKCRKLPKKLLGKERKRRRNLGVLEDDPPTGNSSRERGKDPKNWSPKGREKAEKGTNGSSKAMRLGRNREGDLIQGKFSKSAKAGEGESISQRQKQSAEKSSSEVITT